MSVLITAKNAIKSGRKDVHSELEKKNVQQKVLKQRKMLTPNKPENCQQRRSNSVIEKLNGKMRLIFYTKLELIRLTS